MTAEQLIPWTYPALLLGVFASDTLAGAYRARLEGVFSWMHLTLALWKGLAYGLVAAVAHLQGADGLLMFAVGRELNSLLQNVGHINDLCGVEDNDVFYQLSDWYNLNQRPTQK